MQKKCFAPILYISLAISFMSVSFAKPPKYPLAICSMFQNEAPFLEDWIDFHHQVIGVSHFYLYNNESTDNFLEVLAPYIAQGLVEVIDWASTEEHARRDVTNYLFSTYQVGAFRDCLQNKAYEEAEWVAIIDIDEYIVPAQNVNTLHTLLTAAKEANVGSLQIQWKTFGTSGIYDLNPGERVIEKLIKCAPDDYVVDPAYVMKSIHQPKATAKYCEVHQVNEIEEGYYIQKVPLNVCRIHHYWSGTEKRCNEKRVFNSDEDKRKHLDQINAVEDDSIYRYLNRIKRK